MNDNEVTAWIRRLVRGDDTAVQQVWEHYYERLVRLARKKLGGHKRRVADEEDVVLSAFDSFCRGAAAGRFPRLNDRHDLWNLLMTITSRKAVAQIRREMAEKRGGGALRGESVFLAPGDTDNRPGIGGFLGEEPSPETAAMITEQCGRLLELLGDESLRKVALYKLEGYRTGEIAKMLDCSPGTVERKLARIRKKWADEAQRVGQ